MDKFLNRVRLGIQKITSIYGEIHAILSPEKSALLAFGFRPKQVSIEGICFKPSHRILGITFEKGLYFNEHVKGVTQKLRKYLKWISNFKTILTEKQKRRAFCMFIQSQLDYHLIPIWQMLSKESQRNLTRIVTQSSRVILGSPTTNDGNICCREARILPPSHRVEIMTLRRQLKLKNSTNLAASFYEKRLENLEFREFQENLNEEFLKWSDKLLWTAYQSRYPLRARYFQEEPPKKLANQCRRAFLLRTEQVKTKSWRVRHAQLFLNQQPQDSSCRYCSQMEETVSHLIEDCYHAIPRKARRPLLALHQSMEANQPTLWSASWALTRRGNPIETEALEKALQSWTETVLPVQTCLPNRIQNASSIAELQTQETPLPQHPERSPPERSATRTPSSDGAQQPTPLPALRFRPGVVTFDKQPATTAGPAWGDRGRWPESAVRNGGRRPLPHASANRF